jgi:hypothetical protein
MESNLVVIAVCGFFVVIVAGAAVLILMDIWGPDEKVESETRKIRFGAAILTGMLILFMVVITMYFSSPTNTAAPVIFEKTFTALTPLVGVLIAYFFKKG